MQDCETCTCMTILSLSLPIPWRNVHSPTLARYYRFAHSRHNNYDPHPAVPPRPFLAPLHFPYKTANSHTAPSYYKYSFFIHSSTPLHFTTYFLYLEIQEYLFYSKERLYVLCVCGDIRLKYRFTLC